jgi:hypothetical protein
MPALAATETVDPPWGLLPLFITTARKEGAAPAADDLADVMKQR